MSWIDRRRLWMLPLKWRALGSSRSCPPICLSSCRTSYNTNQGMLSVDLPNFHQTSQQVNMFLHHVFRIVYCNLGKAMNTTTCRLSLWSYGHLAWEQAPLLSSLWNLHHTVWEKTKQVLFVCLLLAGMRPILKMGRHVIQKNNDKSASTQIRKLYIKIWEKGRTHMYMYIYSTYVIYVFCYRKTFGYR